MTLDEARQAVEHHRATGSWGGNGSISDNVLWFLLERKYGSREIIVIVEGMLAEEEPDT